MRARTGGSGSRTVDDDDDGPMSTMAVPVAVPGPNPTGRESLALAATRPADEALLEAASPKGDG